jgi:anti-sigma B factor antagonist
MKIETEVKGKVTVIRVGEERIDANNAGELKIFAAGLVEGGAGIFGIDLQAVAFIDSSGLGALVAVKKRIGQNGAIGLWGLAPQVRSLFDLTQLYKVFEIFETEADALAALDG